MVDRSHEYEQKLMKQRSGSGRASILEERMLAHRKAGLAQKEREVALSNGLEAGTDASYARLANRHKDAVDRAVQILGPGAAQDCRSQVKPAIAFATGIPSLDRALGGGLPSGITEIYGAESVGKSTLLMEMIRSAQDQRINVALLPTEIFDWNRAIRIGVELEKLLVLRGQDERILSAAADYLEEGDNRVLFIDSGTGIRPESGSWWLAMLSWFEGVTSKMSPDCGIVMTNQVRVRRSVDPRKFFAGGTNSTAHRIASYFDVRMELTRENITPHTYDLVINVVANLYSAPHQIVQLPVIKEQGIDVWKDVVRVAGELGVLDERGAYFYHEGILVGHGEEGTARALEYDVLDDAGTPREIGPKVFRQLMQVMSRR